MEQQKVSQKMRDMEEKQEELYYEKRCLRTREGMLLFGPCGPRLAVDVLAPVPGFKGCVDFIHKMNVTELFTVEAEGERMPGDPEVTWYPTHGTAVYEKEGMRIRERKTITGEDVAFALYEWENTSREEQEIVLRSEPVGFRESPGLQESVDFLEGGGQGGPASRDGLSGETGIPFCGLFRESGPIRFGIQLGLAVFWSLPEGHFILKPGNTVCFAVACAVGNLGILGQDGIQQGGDILDQGTFREKAPEDMAILARRAISCIRGAETDREGYWEKLLADNSCFYVQAPVFRCDDHRVDICWKYRWYLLKNSMCRPGYGRFRETVMYEGRDHRMTKEPLSPVGWEFSKLIPLSTPLHVTDLRWHPDHGLTEEVIRSAFAAQDEDGLLLSAYVEGEQKSYANSMIHAIWLYYLVSGAKQLLEELLPAMERYIAGHEKKYGNPVDSLLVEKTHSLTGKEYQPSYWYFQGYLALGQYPRNPKDPQYFTPLKRVDRSVYHYLNLRAIAAIMRVLDRKGWETYEKKADRVQKDILQKMWDPKTGFFYDLHHETDQKAMVRNIVGVYPFWAQMTGEEHRDGILPLMDPEAFRTGSGFPSVSRDCPAFSPAGGWMGNYFKGRDGCVWCGPSWPYTTGIALEALGYQVRGGNQKSGGDSGDSGSASDMEACFDGVWQEYTGQHFRDGDSHRPYLVEHYNPLTGERLSDEADYNHSFWLDLVIQFVAGVALEERGVRIAPLHTHLGWWQLEGLEVRGHCLSVAYSGKAEPGKELKVWLDGNLQAETDLEKGVFLEMPL